jgi:hypothetical protein
LARRLGAWGGAKTAILFGIRALYLEKAALRFEFGALCLAIAALRFEIAALFF